MVGVCLTVIGLIRIVITIGKFDTIADHLLALASLIFLICVSALIGLCEPAEPDGCIDWNESPTPRSSWGC